MIKYILIILLLGCSNIELCKEVNQEIITHQRTGCKNNKAEEVLDRKSR